MLELDECIEVLGGRLTDLEFFGKTWPAQTHHFRKLASIFRSAETNSFIQHGD